MYNVYPVKTILQDACICIWSPVLWKGSEPQKLLFLLQTLNGVSSLAYLISCFMKLSIIEYFLQISFSCTMFFKFNAN